MTVRHRRPLLTRDQLPCRPPRIVDPTAVFNPGACARADGGSDLLLRVQTRGRRTYLLPAVHGADGRCHVAPGISTLHGLPRGLTVHHVYDPRLTRLEGRLFVVTALDTDRGGRLAVWEASDDLARLDLVGLTGDHDTRNGVLFPARVGGRYLLLERPNRVAPAGGPPTGDRVVLLASDDLVSWQEVGPVFAGRPHRWDELVGAGPPPLLTDAGWLLVYHGVATHFGAANVYQAGCVLLDRDDPATVLARTVDNILEPRLPWETTGQVPNVVFPTGLVPRGDGTARLYYGAADTVVGCGIVRLDELVRACRARRDGT